MIIKVKKNTDILSKLYENGDVQVMFSHSLELPIIMYRTS